MFDRIRRKAELKRRARSFQKQCQRQAKILKKALPGYFYSRNIAADIVELFEDVLDEYGITVPSPEDNEKDVGNEARLYGSVYWDLLDKVEGEIIYAVIRSKRSHLVPYIFE